MNKKNENISEDMKESEDTIKSENIKEHENAKVNKNTIENENIKEKIKENEDIIEKENKDTIKNINNEPLKDNNEVNPEVNINPKEKHNKNQKKSVPNIFGYLGRAFTWAVIILSVFFLIRAFAFKKYDVFGFRFYIIMSGSMEPTIHTTDVVIVKENPKHIKNGDIIAFKNDGSITVHRAIGLNEQDGNIKYTTKGDRNNAADMEEVPASEIVGSVVGKIPRLGKLVLFIYSHMIVFICVVALIVAIFIIKSFLF